MKLSFSIPAYNEEFLISKCLASLEREINKEIQNNNLSSTEVEVIVVNNNSTDQTKDIALAFQDKIPNLKVIDENRKGLLFARQTGFENSSGEIIANIDSDHILTVGWLHKVLAYFDKDKDLVALSGPLVYYDLNTYERLITKIFYLPGYLFHEVSLKLFKKGKMLQGGNFIIKKKIWEKAGGFDTKINFYGEDTDVVKRISKYGKAVWTWNLTIYASGRRLREEGVIKTGMIYAVNFLSVSFLGKPVTKKYNDIRKQV